MEMWCLNKGDAKGMVYQTHKLQIYKGNSNVLQALRINRSQS